MFFPPEEISDPQKPHLEFFSAQVYMKICMCITAEEIYASFLQWNTFTSFTCIQFLLQTQEQHYEKYKNYKNNQYHLKVSLKQSQE